MTTVNRTPVGYNTPIPSNIMTPDRVETPIGTLEFFDRLPTDETLTKVFDNLDLIGGVETFLNGISAASGVEGLVSGVSATRRRGGGHRKPIGHGPSQSRPSTDGTSHRPIHTAPGKGFFTILRASLSRSSGRSAGS
jgi:hypothetical protein